RNRIVAVSLVSIVRRGEGEESAAPTVVDSIGDLLKLINANTLFEISCDQARKEVVKGMIADCNSLASQKFDAKNGFTVLREIRQEDIQGANGKPVYVCFDGQPVLN
ncbi:hypothetical protein PENTCL1PPCAC_16201, partial [Pristionchus entomophagus]